MTTSPEGIRPGEIWLAYLHFSDKPDIGKVRPVLVVGVREEAALAVVLKVTSKNPGDGRKSVPLAGWESYGLRKPSYVRVDQIFEVAADSLLGDAPLGTLGSAQFATVLQALAESGR